MLVFTNALIMSNKIIVSLLISLVIVSSCSKEETINDNTNDTVELSPNLPENHFNYANQPFPSYITKDNTDDNSITDAGATLGRVLFYDVNLSENKTISCGSCHQQANAFSDTATLSMGLNGGLTARHSMRLINTRFADEERFFWDERAESLEDQSTKPIQDHIEMGFSGVNGAPSFTDLITRLNNVEYYTGLFTDVYGDREITEEKIQIALAQFIRSIQTFDSRFDIAFSTSDNINQDFQDFTTEENLGKHLFLTMPTDGGAGCVTCHRGAEFDIDPISHNNGVIAVAGSTTKELDFTNMRSPSLRDVVKSDGSSNGPFMHDGSLETLMDVINHYNEIPVNAANISLDQRLSRPGANNQVLNLGEEEKDALVAFLQTLSGSDVYENEKWSDPFSN